MIKEFQVVECPSCGAHHKMRKPKTKLNSYEIYSDGKTISPELDEALEVAACAACGECFWIEDANLPKMEVTEEMPSLKPLTIAQYGGMLDAEVITTDEEEILRMELLWAFNDRVRADKPMFENEGDEELWAQNMTILYNLLDSADVYSRLLKAEIDRERGEFDRAEEILSKIKEGQLAGIKNQLMNAIKYKEREVVKFKE